MKKELKVLWTAARPVELSWNELVFKAIREPGSIISNSVNNHEDIFCNDDCGFVLFYILMASFTSCWSINIYPVLHSFYTLKLKKIVIQKIASFMWSFFNVYVHLTARMALRY